MSYTATYLKHVSLVFISNSILIPVVIQAALDALGMTTEPLAFTTSDTQPSRANVQIALESIYDPEIPVNIDALGLIYGVEIDGSEVTIEMTLTAPGCGMGPVLVKEVEDRVSQVPGVTQVYVNLVFDPPWSREMMSEAA